MNEMPNRPSKSESNFVPKEQFLPQLDQKETDAGQGRPVEREPARESGQERAQAPPVTQTPAQSQPQTRPQDGTSAAVPPNDSGQADDDMPALANDVDVIEKEWVNKAKQIIKETQGNPYEQERAVERLQIDYLKKRYGHDVKANK